MAIVRTGVTSSGVKYAIDDSAYANASREEIARRWREVDRVVNQIHYNIALRTYEAMNQAEKEALRARVEATR